MDFLWLEDDSDFGTGTFWAVAVDQIYLFNSTEVFYR